jgi:hypothetical protein
MVEIAIMEALVCEKTPIAITAARDVMKPSRCQPSLAPHREACSGYNGILMILHHVPAWVT